MRYYLVKEEDIDFLIKKSDALNKDIEAEFRNSEHLQIHYSLPILQKFKEIMRKKENFMGNFEQIINIK